MASSSSEAERPNGGGADERDPPEEIEMEQETEKPQHSLDKDNGRMDEGIDMGAEEIKVDEELATTLLPKKRDDEDQLANGISRINLSELSILKKRTE